MEDYEKIKDILLEEINRLKGTEDLNDFLTSAETFQSNVETIQKFFDIYESELKSNENHLEEISVKLNELINLVGRKYNQFKEEHDKSINMTANNSEQLKEKLELEKSKFRLKYFENNSCYLLMLSTMKNANDKLLEIENLYSDAIVYQENCEGNLLTAERAIEDLKKQKEKEEMARLEEERIELERAKAAALEEKLREQEIERMKKIIEEESKHSEEQVEHFIKIRYDVTNGEFGDIGLGCFMKVAPGFMGSKADLIVDLVDPLILKYDLNGTDEVVSNTIKIKSVHNDSDDLKFDQAFSIVLPHTMSRNDAKEAKVFRYMETESQWIGVDTQDIMMEDTDKSGAKFVEAVFDELPLTVVVVSIPKTEVLKYNKKGCNWSAAVDNRVNFTIPQGAVKINLSMNVTTVVFESNSSQDLKAKSKGTHAENIYTFSPLLKIETSQRRLLKPYIISLPLQKQQKSDSTGMTMKVFGSGNESKTKANFATQELEEKVCILSLDSNKKWIENTDLKIEVDEKKDSIRFEVEKMMDMTFMAVRAKIDANSDHISKGLDLIMDYLKLKQIKIIVAHHNDDPNLIIVSICLSSKVDKVLRSLKEDGFNEKEVQISHDLEINEGETLALRFRGNTKVENEPLDYVHKLMYCSQLKNRVKMRLEVVDKYAQRAKPKFEGFVTITTSKWTKKPQPKIEGQARKGPPQMIDIEEVFPIFDVLLEIPKVPHSSSSKILSQNFHFVSKDSVTEDLIRNLSQKVKEDWKPLAKALNLPRNRIEEIEALTCSNKTTGEMAYEVLKLWIMHLPISKNKEKMLNKALYSINRQDLVEEIKTC